MNRHLWSIQMGMGRKQVWCFKPVFTVFLHGIYRDKSCSRYTAVTVCFGWAGRQSTQVCSIPFGDEAFQFKSPHVISWGTELVLPGDISCHLTTSLENLQMREAKREREWERKRCKRQLLNVLAVIDLKPTKLLVDKVWGELEENRSSCHR